MNFLNKRGSESRFYLTVIVFCLLPFTLVADSSRDDAAVSNFTLQQCVDAALKTNPAVLGAEDAVEISRQKLKFASSQNLPRLKAEETYTGMRHIPQIEMPGAGAISMGQDEFQVDTLRFSQPLYTGGAIRNSIKAARSAVNLQSHLAKSRREDIAQAVAEAWFGFLGARAMEEVASQALHNHLGHEKNVENMMEAGVAVRDDLLKVQVAILERRENIVMAANGVDLALSRLEMLSGLQLEPAMLSESDTIIPQINEEEAQTIASRSHPLLSSFKEAVKIHASSEKAAKGELLPSVAVQWNWNSGTQSNDAQDNWDATLYVGLNLFDGGQTRSKIREAGAARSKASHDLEDMQRNISLAIHQAALRIEEAEARLALSGQAEKQAAESLRLTEERFKAGAVTSQHLLDAESALVSARQRRVSANLDRELARVALLHACGNLEQAIVTAKEDK